MATLTKKPASKGTKDQFVAKKIGANLIATFNKEKYARKVSKEEASIVMKKMEMYNKKPSDRMKAQIVKLLTPATIKAKQDEEAIEAKAKGIKHQIKKEVKRSKSKDSEKERINLIEQVETAIRKNEVDVEQLQAMVDRYKKVEEKAPLSEQTTTPWRGETYRNY